MAERVRQGAAVLLFRDDGRFLMQRRGRGCAAGYWSVPGGRREPGERMRATVQREALEEVGVRVLGVRHVLETVETHPCCGQRWQTVWYTSDRWVGDPVTSEEATRLFWAGWDDLPAPVWELLAGHLPTLRSVLEVAG